MKRTKQTALTAAVFAAAIGVSFTGSIPAEADTAQYLAATDQREMQILYGPGPNIEREIEGDINADRVLDARDLTLMKRKLLMDDTTGVVKPYNFYSADPAFNASDARALAMHLTGELYAVPKRPVEFRLYFWPVPYFGDEAPDTEAEQLKLVKEAKLRLERLCLDEMKTYDLWPSVSLSAAAEKPNTALCWQEKLFANQSLLGANYERYFDYYSIPHCFAPNEYWDEALPDAEYLSLQRAEISVTVPFEADFDPETDSPPDTPVQNSYSGSYVTYIQRPDGSEEYFDKILIEWNVNTGKVRMHDTLTPEQEIPEWSALKYSDLYG